MTEPPESEAQRYADAQEDWANVLDVEPGFKRNEEGEETSRRQQLGFGQRPLITTDQIIEDFRNQDLTEQMKQVDGEFAQLHRRNGSLRKKFLDSLSCIVRRRRERHLCAALKRQENLVFAIAKCPFDNDNPKHFRVLSTLYDRLTGDDAVDCCPRYGGHWERIGFQGNDPSTDLRGVGFLGLIQMLHFCMTPELSDLLRAVYRLSTSADQEFPLMVLSINVTRIALHALRDGLLNRKIVRDGGVWSVFNRFYVAVMYRIFHVWKTHRKTIEDSGYVLKDCEKFCRKNVNQTFVDLNTHLISCRAKRQKYEAIETLETVLDHAKAKENIVQKS